jgi:hypothetical protein
MMDPDREQLMRDLAERANSEDWNDSATAMVWYTQLPQPSIADPLDQVSALRQAFIEGMIVGRTRGR